jgi:taurine dioxygenase
MKIEEYQPEFGATVSDINLKNMSKEEIENIRSLLHRYKVVSFLDQDFSLDEYEQVMLQFGKFGENRFLNPFDSNHPYMVRVWRPEGEQRALFGGVWHSDWSFEQRPPDYTSLYCKKTPESSGETLFTDQHQAYNELPRELKEKLEKLTGIHAAARSYSPTGYSAYINLPSDVFSPILSEDAYQEVEHPLIMIHPKLEKKAIFVNSTYTLRIKELNEKDSEDLLRQLYVYQSKRKFRYSIQWKPNMLTIWDNRSVQHKATSSNGEERLMYRLLVNEN